MEQNVEQMFLPVFTGETWQAKMIQNVLEANNIFVQLKNGLMSSIEPWAVTPGGFGAAEVLVPNADYDKAMELLEEFNSSQAE
ncbi:putative signal transducing protein [Pedobacter sp. PWIIR3]